MPLNQNTDEEMVLNDRERTKDRAKCEHERKKPPRVNASMEWEKETQTYNKFSSTSPSRFLSHSSKFTFLQQIWFAVQLLFFFFGVFLFLFLFSPLRYLKSHAHHFVLLFANDFLRAKQQERDVFTTTLSKELHFRGIPLCIVFVRFAFNAQPL